MKSRLSRLQVNFGRSPRIWNNREPVPRSRRGSLRKSWTKENPLSSTEKKETDRPGRKNIRPIILTAFASILLGSFHRYLNIVALRFKSKKRNREGKQRGSNASDQFALTKNSPSEIRRCPTFSLFRVSDLSRAIIAPTMTRKRLTSSYAPVTVGPKDSRNLFLRTKYPPSTFHLWLSPRSETDPPIIRPVLYKFTLKRLSTRPASERARCSAISRVQTRSSETELVSTYPRRWEQLVASDFEELNLQCSYE